ncbi:hypothetical protein KC571_03885 [candidate division WWE3 bacterium]|uniref:Uncharacterized protein n=1 Tax=candidate division WWE3 bacterium TaxID=2053526 RepID=A0A955RPR3_UNCKA|nr:hypothetical protein [candidate division WWE3 bacterium]
MKKVVLILGAILGLLLIIILLVGGYFGFVPIISDVFGATTPQDLGISYSEADYSSFNEKAGTQIITKQETLAPVDSVAYSGSHAVNLTFSAEEMSARLNYNEWPYQPVTNIQIKPHDDGTVEISGNINLDQIDEFLQASGYSLSEADIAQYTPYIALIKTSPALYIKAKPTVTNNRVQLNFESATVARYTISANDYNAAAVLDNWGNSLLSSVTGADIKSVTFDAQGMHVQGKIPDSVTITTHE